jgi:hypothetical protein
MISASDASIVPITLTVNGRTGLTLWAPPWEDDDGQEWQGFLGDGAKIVLFPGIEELAEFITNGTENDLSDHPAWGRVQRLTPNQLRPSSEDAYDLDRVYEWAAGEPDPVHVSALANVVDMVGKIADCCDDGALRRLIEDTPEYEDLVSDDVSYQGREGARRWNELGDVIAETWERAIARVESWLDWRGDFSESELEVETIWERVGAEPIELTVPAGSYLTVRASRDDEALFLGSDGEVVVFTDVADLARFCRTAKDHELVQLEWWWELAETKPAEDEEIFTPEPEACFDLREPTSRGSELLRALATFCQLDADLPEPDDAIDPQTWGRLVAEVESCMRPQD